VEGDAVRFDFQEIWDVSKEMIALIGPRSQKEELGFKALKAECEIALSHELVTWSINVLAFKGDVRADD